MPRVVAVEEPGDAPRGAAEQHHDGGTAARRGPGRPAPLPPRHRCRATWAAQPPHEADAGGEGHHQQQERAGATARAPTSPARRPRAAADRVDGKHHHRSGTHVAAGNGLRIRRTPNCSTASVIMGTAVSVAAEPSSAPGRETVLDASRALQGGPGTRDGRRPHRRGPPLAAARPDRSCPCTLGWPGDRNVPNPSNVAVRPRRRRLPDPRADTGPPPRPPCPSAGRAAGDRPGRPDTPTVDRAPRYDSTR